MISLTPQMAALKAFIDVRISETAVAPSFDEMREHLGLRSKNSVHRLIVSLEERGHIRRLHRRARAIEVLWVSA